MLKSQITIMSRKYANFLNVVIYQYILNEDHDRVIVICFSKMVLHSRGIFNHLWKVLEIDRKDVIGEGLNLNN